ncbi:MAG: response regulator [Thainema sp.]
MKILLVEDDAQIGQFLSATLTTHRYAVDVVADGQTGLDLAIERDYDVILLDVLLPKLNGIEVCRTLRQYGRTTPILMLTGKGTNEDVVMGLDAGADDYVVKPCDPARLLARIRALLRRQEATSSLILSWGDLQLDLTLIQATYRQQTIALSPKEYSLLELFLRHPQRIFSRSNIIDRLWSIDDSPTDAAVTNLIKDLRRRLRSAGIEEEMIETVYRLGYRLKAPPSKADSAASPTSDTAGSANSPSSPATPAPQSPEPADALVADSLAERQRADALNQTVSSVPLNQSALYQSEFSSQSSPVSESGASPDQAKQEGLLLLQQAIQDFRASLPSRMQSLETAIQQLQIQLGEDQFADPVSDPASDQTLDQTSADQASDASDSWSALVLIVAQIRDQAHRLAGGLGTFGYTKAGQLAQTIEQMLDAWLNAGSADGDRDEAGDTTARRQAIQQLVNPITTLLADLKQATVSDPETPMISMPEVAVDALPMSQLSIVVMDDDHSFTQLLQQIALLRNAEVDVVLDESGLWQRLQAQVPSVLLLSLNIEGMSHALLDLLEQVTERYPDLPVLALAETDQLRDRMLVTQKGGRGYILKSATLDEVFEAILLALPATQMGAKVLLVDDDSIMLSTLAALLEPQRLNLTTLSNPAQFWQVLTQIQPEVLLLDLEMPQFNGLELCRVVRQDARYRNLPILVVTAYTDEDRLQKAFAAGADDFIRKPVEPKDFVMRVLRQIEKMRHQRQQQQLQHQQLQTWYNQARQDTLTRVANRRYFDEFLAQTWQQCQHQQMFVSLILADVDLFKAYNDAHGHVAGDQCLQQIARVLQDCVQSRQDLVARYGGEEFAVILPETNLNGALQVAERIRAAIADLKIRHPDSPVSDYVTLSLGITGVIPSDRHSPHDLIAIADQALYAAKKRGRNTYCLYPL